MVMMMMMMMVVVVVRSGAVRRRRFGGRVGAAAAWDGVGDGQRLLDLSDRVNDRRRRRRSATRIAWNTRRSQMEFYAMEKVRVRVLEDDAQGTEMEG